MKKAYIGGGCFWCLEAVFQQIKGVEKVVSGFSGGNIKNPTYREIGSGLTGHAEVIELTYDEDQINFGDLLNVFWHIHDPTTLNRQGNDRGPQYRSIILFQDDEEKQIALESKNKTDDSDLWADSIVTEISAYDKFYPAESYHQNYYNGNKDKNPYCSIVIAPKIAKFHKGFPHLLKNVG